MGSVSWRKRGNRYLVSWRLGTDPEMAGSGWGGSRWIT